MLHIYLHIVSGCFPHEIAKMSICDKTLWLPEPEVLKMQPFICFSNLEFFVLKLAPLKQKGSRYQAMIKYRSPLLYPHGPFIYSKVLFLFTLVHMHEDYCIEQVLFARGLLYNFSIETFSEFLH